MKKTNTLKSIFSRFKAKIIGTFLLLLTETALVVATPFVFGMAIDGLIDGILYWPAVLAGVLTLLTLIGTLRRLYDTRTYTSIYRIIAPEVVASESANASTISETVTRVNLSKELVDFFENEMTEGLTSFVKIVGAVLMLAVFDMRIAGLAFIALFLILLVYIVTEKPVYRGNQRLNDELEKQVSIISGNSSGLIRSHFRILGKRYVRLSDIESINYAVIALILTALIIASLMVAVSWPEATTGKLFAVLTYVFEFSEGIYILPMIYQQLIRLKEISHRLSLKDMQVELT